MSSPTAHSTEVLVSCDTTSPTSSASDLNQATTVRVHNHESTTDPAIEAFLINKIGADDERPPESSPEILLPPFFSPAPGYLVGGRYRLETPLASGGMGSVWAARHLDLDVPVAVKLMSPELGRSSRQRARFVLEAKAAARLRSRNVVAVLDYGVDQCTPYIIMERLDGEDLWTRLTRRRSLSFPEIFKLLDAITSALELAHAAGIVHRDLKPENIFLSRVAGEPEEVVKVLDFGVAKELEPSDDDDPTTTGIVVGTPCYMSPEQARGARSIDHRSDLWSVGIILYRAVTGQLPFESTAPMDVFTAILSDPIKPPSSVAPHVPVEIDRFFERALDRDPSARFQSIREMASAFHDAAPECLWSEGLAPAEDDAVALTSGDFVAIATQQIKPWASGVPVLSRKTIIPPERPDAITASRGGWLSKLLSRLRQPIT